MNNEEYVYKFHLQNAFQRISMELADDDFATFIMDELNKDVVKQIKSVCHEMTIKGDFVKYDNIYQGILIDNSIYCPGIQLANYAVGVLNGYIRQELLNRGHYEYAIDLYNKYISPLIRCNYNGKRLGFGVVDVPGRPDVRTKLSRIFDN